MNAARRSSNVRRLPAKRAGFALLITLTLLAFLVVLLVGLATYTRIETAIAGNTQRQEQARQNALLALNIALGQLQHYAGPDQRVTATAEAFGTANAHFTGVWNAAPDVAASTTPLTWLVSGNELLAADGTPNALAITPAKSLTTAGANPNAVELVGLKTSGNANDVVAPLERITSVAIPGAAATANTAIGRYAWWVGDQGVKAPVALGDPTVTAGNFNFAPYDSAEVLSRVRQQISLGAGPAAATGAPVLEPRDANNAVLVANQKISAFNQLAFLKTSATTPTAFGLTQVQKYFHSWSPNNFNVLANTKLGGLRQDLSVDPTLLGPSFAAWANYDPKNGGYMEDPTATIDPKPLQPYSADPLRRRYVMQSGGVSVAPVVSYFLLSFNVHTQGGSQAVRPLEVRAFWKVGMWNPYSAALVPENNLRLEVTGLPNIRIDDDDPTHGGVVASLSLQNLYGSANPNNALRIVLPWNSSVSNGVPGDDRASWLPGRVYNWRSAEELTGTIPLAGYPSRFYAKSYTSGGEANGGVIRPISSAPVDGNDLCHIDGDSRSIKIKLIAVRPSGDVELANFTSPQFSSFSTTSRQLYLNSTQFVYIFRVAESTENSDWLKTAGADLHDPAPIADVYAFGPNGNSPAAYAAGYEDSTFPDRLLDRDTTSYTYNEDVPLFELPRSPILSLGMLQHLALPGQRPFAIGNSWSMDPAESVQLNGTNVSELFDRYFFSGLVTNVAPITVGTTLQLPNPLLKLLPRNSATALATTLGDLQAVPAAHTSKFLMQGGAFNVNSVDPLAWTAVLRAHRFPAPSSFKYLDADAGTGTAADDAIASVQSGDAQFFRFSQSAQETYKAEAGNSGGTAATELFRQGMRTLTPTDVSALAQQVGDLVSKKHKNTDDTQAPPGPFRSLEEFLKPWPLFGGQSLLENAVANTGLNAAVAEFSSQFLTQADIMTALAPVLFPRSDTFVIRAYGEALNPITSTAAAPVVEGRAWCEAIVQRVPEYFNATADDATASPNALNDPLNAIYGRRFKIVSFRWLTRSDI
ncbi:MAG TPA: hypothetical protein VHD62_04850 [Opitutaceae bacterium]|nr:hypothetical protein [Opitutaceae bacterium]